MVPRRGKEKSPFLCFLFSVMALIPLSCFYAQGAEPQDQAADFEKLLKDMDSALASGGENGFQTWARANKNHIGNDFIVFLAQQAVESRSGGILRAAQILALEKGEAKARADVLFLSGKFYLQASSYKNALIFFQGAEGLYADLDDRPGQGNVFSNEGEAYLFMGETSKALAMYHKALPFFERNHDLLGQAHIYSSEGDIYCYLGENAEALARYEKALPLYQSIPDLLGEGGVYLGQGDVYRRSGESAKALAMYQKALPLFEKVANHIGQGNVYLFEADIFFHAGESAQALALCEKALSFFETAKDLRGQGNVRQLQGDIYALTSEVGKALASYEKALAFFEMIKDPIGRGNVYKSEGHIYGNMGENAKALAMYEKALPLFEIAREPLGQGNTLLAEGQIHSAMGENGKALAMFEKALPFFEKADDPLGQGNVYDSQGAVSLQAGDYAQALTMYEKALPFFQKIQDPTGQGRIYRSEGIIFLCTGETLKALAMFEAAVSQFTKSGATESLAYALTGKADALARQSLKAEALQFYDIAVDNLEKVRAQIAIPEMKKSFLQKVFDIYDHSALFMLENDYSEKGFRVVESLKARLFLDQLAENRASADKGLDPALKERRDRLTGKLSAMDKSLAQAAGKNDEAKLSALKKERDGYLAEFQKLQIEIRLKNPAYAAVRYPQPVSLDDLQKKVLRPGEVLLEYYLSDTKAFAFVGTQAAFKAVELPAGSQAIRSAVQNYLDWVSNPYRQPAEEENRIAAGASLYNQLLKPLESDFSEGAHLILVPDGVLAKLPFECLVVSLDPASKRPVYLLEKYPLKYIPSASVLAFLRTQFQQEGVTEAFIGFGDPVYDYENFKKGKPEKGSIPGLKGDVLAELNRERFAREGGTLNRLQGSGQEVAGIAELFQKKGKAEPRLRLEASEENAKAPALRDYGYILFSCHGLLGDGYQCLALSQIPGAEEDGFLTLGEVMNCDYNARLVVLSACQTGKGPEERGEGVTGLTRAVMYAGSPAAVVGLWSVSDAATKELMIGFFRRLIEDGLPKEEALRRAKLEILRGKAIFRIKDDISISLSHPFFWAAFVMYGE